MQVADDLFDFHEDIKQRVPNIAVSVLKYNPSEMQRAMTLKKMSFWKFKKQCPKSFNELMEIIQKYSSKIPQTTESLQTVSPFPPFFLRLMAVTKRKYPVYAQLPQTSRPLT
ncbi:MAG: hypothetical protein WCI04_01310 [archaeon]